MLGEPEMRAWVGDEIIQRYGVAACMALKFRLFDIFPGADSILYFDADLVFLQPWDPSIFRGSPDFICVRDQWFREFIQEEANRIGIDAHRYFNFGFFIASRACHAALRAAMDRLDLTDKLNCRLFEQSVVNRVFADLNVPICYVDQRYNSIGWAMDRDMSCLVPVMAAHKPLRRRV